MINTVDVQSFGFPVKKYERNLIDLNLYRFTLSSNRFKKGLSKEKLPKDLIDSVKSFIKDKHPDITKEAFGNSEVKQRLSNIISNYISSKKITEEFKGSLSELTQRELVSILVEHIAGFGPIDYLFDIPSTTDININRYDDIWIDDYITGPRKIDAKFESKDAYIEFLNKVMNEANTSLSYKKPQASGSLPILRFDIVGHDLSDNTTCSIRVHTKDLRISEQSVIETKQANKEMMLFFEQLMRSSISFIISGATGTGKTEFLRLLAGYSIDSQRIITIEDEKELFLKHLYPNKNIADWNTRVQINEDGKEWGLGALVDTSLRHYPYHLFIGETRGKELAQMVKASETGHSIRTGLHAKSAKEQVKRMITMLKEFRHGNNDDYGKQITENIKIGIHLKRVGRNRQRTVSEVIEYEGFENNEVKYRTLFRYDHKLNTHVQVNKISEELFEYLVEESFVDLEKISFLLPENALIEEVCV